MRYNSTTHETESEYNMTYTTPKSRMVSETIERYCAGQTTSAVLEAQINQLSQTDLMDVNRTGQTLFLKAIELSQLYHSAYCSFVMRTLATQATQVGGHSANLLYYLMYTGSSLSPLQSLLHIDSTDAVTFRGDGVGKAYFDILSTMPIPPSRVAQLLPLNRKTLYAAFMCKHEFNRNAFLDWAIYRPAALTLLSKETLVDVFLEPDNKGYRLLDQLILNAKPNHLKAFIETLRTLFTVVYHDPVSHATILNSHPLENQGFSPLHEVLRTNNLGAL